MYCFVFDFLANPSEKEVTPLSSVPCRDSGFSLGSLPPRSVLIENVVFACCRIARSRHIIVFAVCKKKNIPHVVGGQRPMSEHSREAGRQLGRIKRSVPFISLFASPNSVNNKLRGVLPSYSCQCPTGQPSMLNSRSLHIDEGQHFLCSSRSPCDVMTYFFGKLKWAMSPKAT